MLSQNDIRLVERKWGYFLQFTENENTTIKLLHVKKGQHISYQYHHNRSEQWYLIKGKIMVTRGTFSEFVLPGQVITIARLEKHKLEALDESIVLEISKGYFDEKDIVRL